MAHLARLELGSQSVQLALLVLLLFQLLRIQLLQQMQMLSMQETLHPQQWCVCTGNCALMLGNAPRSSCMLAAQQCSSRLDFTAQGHTPSILRELSRVLSSVLSCSISCTSVRPSLQIVLMATHWQLPRMMTMLDDCKTCCCAVLCTAQPVAKHGAPPPAPAGCLLDPCDT